jgi:predicted nucleotidyltransferase
MENIREKIKKAVEKNPYKKDIRRVSLFGSELHGTAKEGSDVDLLVEFMPGAKISFFKLDDIEESFEKELGRNVDLVTPRALSHFFRDKVLAEAELLYQS